MVKIFDEMSCRNWLEANEVAVDTFIRNRWNVDDFDLIKWRIFKDSILGKQAIQDYMKQNEDKISDIVNLINGSSMIIIVSGARGMGKSCTTHMLCKELHNKYGREIFYVGSPMNIDKDFFHSYDIATTPMNSINVIDESALLANSRKAMGESNISLTEVLPTLRHVG